MKHTGLRVACAALTLVGGPAAMVQAGGGMAWELAGFAQPETVVFDPSRGVFYVSNIAGEPLGADGVG